MINTATSLGGRTASGELVKFVVGEAEACDRIEGLEEESVDVITGAMAVCACFYSSAKSFVDYVR